MTKNASKPQTDRELLLILSRNVEIIQRDIGENHDKLEDVWKLLYGYDEENPGLKQRVYQNYHTIKSIRHRFWWFLGIFLPVFSFFVARWLVGWPK